MKVVESISEWQNIRSSIQKPKTIGFVPTMGNLHQGHFSLFQKSLEENQLTVGSIFVNPTQFNQPEDYLNYPKTLEHDIDKLTELGVDYCLIPTQEELYVDDFHFQVTENNISLTMEGQHRPGHFTGVLTVVMKLLQLIKPHKSYFGMKDYQQLKLIQGMVQAFFMDTEVIGCPIIREESGLACSSRNNRLNNDEKKLAEQFASIFHQCLDIASTQKALNALGIDVEYIEDREGQRFIAVKIGDIRLIDNFELP